MEFPELIGRDSEAERTGKRESESMGIVRMLVVVSCKLATQGFPQSSGLFSLLQHSPNSLVNRSDPRNT